MRRIGRMRGFALGVGALLVLGAPSTPNVAAVDASSTTYRLNESSIGAGSLTQSSSTNYRASDAVGDVGVGNTSSTNYQVNAGNKTPVDPNLTVTITSGSTALPAFSATAGSVATATFSVQNYTSYGYAVQIAGTSPSNGSKTIPALATATSPAVGTEQFGINLVANTSPSSVGANPDNGSYGFGAAAGNYSTPNKFRYVSGETIALAPKSSGVTNYTISFLVNVSGLTPGGVYSTNQTLIVTGTY